MSTQLIESPRGDVRTPTFGESVIGLLRWFQRERTRMLDSGDVEWATQMLLHRVRAEGPTRAGALAAQLGADPSTVSRQVAALVKQGLLERQPDPDDGRACLLVLTGRADDRLAEHARRRDEFLRSVTSAWDPDEVEHFGRLLDRFVDDLERSGGLPSAEQPSTDHPSTDVPATHQRSTRHQATPHRAKESR